MAVEYEIKFRATPEQMMAVEAACAVAPRLFDMHTVYYDTPGGDLAARKFTLRRRMENENSVCTLKTPASGLGRNEFELNCPAIEQALPRLCQMAGIPELPKLVANGVVPICGAAFRRKAITITRPDCTVELALDQGILTGGGKEIPLCEVEVELKKGSRDGAKAYAAMLQVAFGLIPEKKSKFRRALDLAKGEV